MIGKQIDITPTTGVYATYKNLRYEPWTALAEFVDNSTQSYFDHKDELFKSNDFGHLKIIIDYKTDNQGDFIKITDNAFGMEADDFVRAISLDKPPLDKSGRNEFGMGLKTAACWFGTLWTVTTTQLGSNIIYKASVDVKKLSDTHESKVDVDFEKTDPNTHFTVIEIRNLNKRITGSRTIGKVKDFLSSIYREDLRRGDIEIRFKDSLLEFKDPSIYFETLSDGTKHFYKKDVSFSIARGGNEYKVYGFVGLRDPGSHQDAGFTLIRRGRVIIGGPGSNYRPDELFGYSGGYPYQRLFGELHMDNWPVTQAKDNFDWHTDGLEEEFIEKLSPLISDYKLKANDYLSSVDSSSILEKVGDNMEKNGFIQNAKVESLTEEEVSSVFPTYSSEGYDHSNSGEEENRTVVNKSPAPKKWSFIFDGEAYQFYIFYDLSDLFHPWLLVEPLKEHCYKLTINMRHKFFEPFISRDDFIELITRFVVCMVLSEIKASFRYPDGRYENGDVRDLMNSYLSQIAGQNNGK